MNKVDEAKEILKTLGLPLPQQNEIAAYTLLALSGIGPDDVWRDSKRQSVSVSNGIMSFIADKYGKAYAPNTRETIRKNVLHYFDQARIVDYNPDNPLLPTNSPKAHYALTPDALEAIQAYGTPSWEAMAQSFTSRLGNLNEIYMKKRSMQMIPVTLSDGTTLELSPGSHNEVQAAIVEKFAPRFAPGSTLLYLGDTINKDLVLEKEKLQQLGVTVTDHDKLPDVILIDTARNWLFLVEAVTSRGPMNPKRIIELEKMFENCTVGKVYVTAFPDRIEFRKHVSEIAWETEVWIAKDPDHMIHFNGDRFMGPR